MVPRGRFHLDKSDNQASETIADLDVEKLKKEILALEPGENFTLEKRLGDVSDRRDDGGVNIHIPIKFEGGKEWLLRIPSLSDVPEPADMVAQVRTRRSSPTKLFVRAEYSFPRSIAGVSEPCPKVQVSSNAAIG